jgi:hypothetical protein
MEGARTGWEAFHHPVPLLLGRGRPVDFSTADFRFLSKSLSRNSRAAHIWK